MRKNRVVAVMLAALALAACSKQLPLGPLDQNRDSTSGASVTVSIGDEFTYGGGVIYIQLESDVSGVQIVGVEPNINGDGLRFLGVHTASVADGDLGPQILYEWPPGEGDVPGLSDPTGAVLDGSGARPGHSVYQEFYLGFEATEVGRTTVRGVRVIYADDENLYSLVIPHTLAVCVEVAIPPGSEDDCEFEEEIEFDH